MATILFAWEFGGGIGHLVRLRPVAERLRALGHCVWIVAKDEHAAKTIFAGCDVPILPAPHSMPRSEQEVEVRSFTDVLQNLGFAVADSLAMRLHSWRHLLGLIKPDLLVCEFSPGALLAARGLRIRTATIGNGFSCPSNSRPLLNLFPDRSVEESVLLAREEKMLKVLNECLVRLAAPRLESMAQLFSEVDAEFITDFAELDPYQNRGATEYRGLWPKFGERPAEWPTTLRPRVFAYLKASPPTYAALRALVAQPWSTLVVGSDLPIGWVRELENKNLQITNEPLDIAAACAGCDFAVLNATHGTTVAALLAGKPILLLPLFVEHGLIAQRVTAMGAGVMPSREGPFNVHELLDNMVSCASYQDAARKFAAKYAAYDSDHSINQIVAELNSLAR